MNSPDISVIIPVHNREKYISRAIRSILNQSISHEKYEIIVIDDGSDDSSISVIETFKDKIRLFVNDKNIGLPGSLNKGINNARGRFIIRLDSDDYVHYDYLKIPYLFLSFNSNFDAVCCDYYIVDDHENISSRENAKKSPIGCGIMFRQEHLISIGLYDENQKLNEEKELMYRFKKKFKVERIPLPLYRYRKHENNMTDDPKLKKIFN